MPPFANIRIINIVFSESKDVKSSEIEIQSLDKVYLFLFSSCFPPLSLPQSLSSDETKKTIKKYLYKFVLFVTTSVYLVVVEVVHEDLHDTREYHYAGAGDEEGVDVVK